jgi:putative transposase
MPRPPREEFPGAIHHVWARGNRKALIFHDDLDRLRYLALLGRVATMFGWRCLAYCLMGNHVHLVVETPEANLGAGMERLHGEYAARFNRRHGLVGHVFQGRYKNRRPTSDAQLWVLIAYVANNPVAAGLCDTAEEWRWSSHRATVAGGAPEWLDVRRLLEYFGAFGGDPLERYVDFVAQRPGW